MDNKCKECTKTFSNYGNLRQHVKKFHNQKISELAPYKKNVKFKFKCDVCGKNFNYQKHLRYHQKSHGITNPLQFIPRPSENCKKCPMCDFKSNFATEFFQHFQHQHDISLHEEQHQFTDVGAFEKWKTSMEKITKSKYVKSTKFGTKTHTTTKYVCHRSGYYITEGKGKRNLKTQGSNKINAYCPSGITVIEDLDGTINVKFLKTHVGHQNDIKHLILTSAERKSIAEKIKSKIPFSVILDEMRNSVENSKLERKHLLTRKDLHNIIKSYNLNSTSVEHKEDVVSVEVKAKEMENEVSLFVGEQQMSTSPVNAKGSSCYVADLNPKQCSAGERETSTFLVITSRSPSYVGDLKPEQCSAGEQQTSTTSPMIVPGPPSCVGNLKPEHCYAREQETSNSLVIASDFPHYLGDLKPEHFSSPRKCKRSLELVHKKVVKEEKRRLEKRIESFKELLEQLRESNLLSQDASQEIMNFWSFH